MVDALRVLRTPSANLANADCVSVLRGLPDGLVDAVITDPPYAEIDRDYGRFTEEQWWDLMRPLVKEIRRVLKPEGSAVFILQANSERIGRMRPWLFDFMGWIARDWNLIQDVWWWNPSTPPTAHCQQKYGLMRPSMKACVWAGLPDCYRDQSAVLWTESDAMKARRQEGRAGRTTTPSGMSVDFSKFKDRGGSTPFNLLPISNTNSASSGGAFGHGAATPSGLCDWWIRYLTKPGGLILDPFVGSGTVALRSVALGRRALGIERSADYFEIAKGRLQAANP